MSILLTLVAPALGKTLDFCFWTGFATAYQLRGKSNSRKEGRVKGGVGALPKQRKKSATSSPTYARNRALRPLPNDPDRQGNIWHQYEALERAKTALETQMAEERALHKKEMRRLESQIPGRSLKRDNSLPPLKPLEEKSPSELARELSESRLDLERLTVELSDAHNQVDFLKSEKSVLATENEKLKKLGGSSQNRRNANGVRGNTPFEVGGPPAAAFADDALRRRPPIEGMSSFGSDIEFTQQSLLGVGRQDSGSSSRGLPPKDDVSAGQAFRGGTVSNERLAEQNKKLASENQRLQKKLLKLDGGMQSTPDPQLRENYDRLVEENARLQNKLLRLDGEASGGGDAQLKQDNNLLRAENSELKEDNDKLVEFLESLEKRKQELEDALMKSSGNAKKIQQLEADNAALLDKVEKLKARAKQTGLMTTNSSFTSIAIPVSSETGEELDTDLWMLVEQLRDQNRNLIEENKSLKSLTSKSSATSSNPDSEQGNVSSLLREENQRLDAECKRLTRLLVADAPPKERELLDEALQTNQRLQIDKDEVKAQMQRLVSKNQKLLLENDSLLKQLHSLDHSSKGTITKQDSKSFMSRFSRTMKRKPSGKEGKTLLESDSDSLGDPDRAGSLTEKGSERSKEDLVQQILEENNRLLEKIDRMDSRAKDSDRMKAMNEQLVIENNALQESVGALHELTKENSVLLEQNRHLTQSLDLCLAENKALSARLQTSALKLNEERPLGDGRSMGQAAPQPAASPSLQPQAAQGGAQGFGSQKTIPFHSMKSIRPPKPASPWENTVSSEETSSDEGSDGENPLFISKNPPPNLPPLRRDQGHAAKAAHVESHLGRYITRSHEIAKGNQTGVVTQEQKQLAQETVQKAFFQYCGVHDDLGSFLKALGYEGFEPLPESAGEDEILKVYHKALDVTADTQLSNTASPQEKALAERTANQLEEWYLSFLASS